MDVSGSHGKRWSFQEEILKLFNASLKHSFPDLEEEVMLYGSQAGKSGDYNCQNVLTIWPKLRKSPELREKYSHILEPKHIGEEIKKNLPTYVIDMTYKEEFLEDVGFVPLTLSRKWLAKSIQMMLKDGIKTWAPKLPVEKVVIGFPTLKEETPVGYFRREAIRFTLACMLTYSDVDVVHSLRPEVLGLDKGGADILSSLFSIEDRVTNVVIDGRGTVPFVLTKEDFCNSGVDLGALREVTESQTVDWVVYVAPVRQQEYVEMCFTAAKHEKWVVTGRKLNWNPSLNNKYPVATYAGYRTCSTEQEELVNLLRRLRHHCYLVAQGRDAVLLGYSADAVFDGVLWYTCLKNHRLADCTFDFNEMVDEEGDTFVYLLRGRAEIRRIIDGSCNDIHDLEASDLILEKYEEWEDSEERMLEGHLLRFTEVLKKACLSVLPHMMCEYLYDLTKKFNSYYDFVREAGHVAKATAVVMDKCFNLLGITPELLYASQCNGYRGRQMYFSLKCYKGLALARQGVEVEPDKEKQNMDEIEQTAKILQDQKFVNRFITPAFVSGVRDPARNSRFELFSIRPLITTDSRFEKGKLFGFISASDKYGLRSDVGYHFFEPDFPYVSLFEFDWCEPVKMRNGWIVYMENSGSHRSVPFSSSMEIFLQLFVTTKKEDACFELADSKFKLDLLDIWSENVNSKCGRTNFVGEDGSTAMHYILIKNAVDTVLEVTFNKGKHEDAFGHIYAYYGDFSYNSWGDYEHCYKALLFKSWLHNGTLSLKRSNLAVPKDASLIIEAHILDRERMVLVRNHKFVLPMTMTRDCISEFTLYGGEGTTCSLDLKVVWKY